MTLSLRTQILVPFAAMTLLVLFAVAMFNAYLGSQRAKQDVQKRIVDVVETLQNSSFPLTDAVLSQMSGLSGAQFMISHRGGKISASTLPTEIEFAPDVQESSEDELLGDPIEVAGADYFYSKVRLSRFSSGQQLHVLYPLSAYREIRWAAIKPPLVVGLLSSFLIIGVASFVAARVTRPLRNLTEQVNTIAEGDFEVAVTPYGSTEIIDLAASINAMARRLAQYEQQIRRSEQLKTLTQVGAGLAHQLRNSITGCRIALDLHAQRCATPDDDSIDVAVRQLSLMDEYVSRFLAVGRSRMVVKKQNVDLKSLFHETQPLLSVTARHAKVKLQWTTSDTSVCLSGDPLALQHLIINLVTNAIEAVMPCDVGDRLVDVDLRQEDRRIVISVSDNGPGPQEEMRHRLFDELVTDKPDGVGLGLAVAADVVKYHSGSITWKRESNRTCFRVELPLSAED